MGKTIHLIGATGRSGQALARTIISQGDHVVPVVRSVEKWQATRLPGEARRADLEGDGLRDALEDAAFIVSTAHARHIPTILSVSPPQARLVFLGSTRKFTRWPDAHGNGVLRGERALLDSGRDGVILHPTMIYGAQGENNVRRLATILSRLPIAPLPNGGMSKVQPIHQSDVTRSVLAALDSKMPMPASVVIAGPNAMSYADFIRAVAHAAKLRTPRIVSVPMVVMQCAAIASILPGLPRIHGDEIRRLLEDKAFDISTMKLDLGVDPIPLEHGLAQTFAQPM